MGNGITNVSEKNEGYLSYMMRLLRTQSGETQVWRVSLEEPLTAQIYRFEDLHSLFDFLVAQTGQTESARVEQ